MNTKNLILEKSLDLFAEKGYYATSVRDIAALVGIKDSSLYFHYKNKQAIFDAITNQFIELSNSMISFMINATDELSFMNDEIFLSVTEQYISTYFLNDFIRKYIIVMNHEQSSNKSIRAIYTEWFIVKPVQFQTELFRKLIAINYLKEDDLSQMVIAYYAPIFLYFNRYISYRISSKEESAFIKNTLETTRHFLSIYKEK